MSGGNAKDSESDAQLVGELFPFSISFDGAMRVTAVGARWATFAPTVRVGESFLDHFDIERPTEVRTCDDIRRHTADVFVMVLKSRPDFKLRGQFVAREDTLKFVGGPWITRISDLPRFGLELSDFPPHDPRGDFLVLLQTQESTLADLKSLAARLRATGAKMEAEMKLREQFEAQARQSQKLEAVARLAGGIAHDFNNILGAIISFTEIVRMDHPQDTELRENLGEVLKACNRATGLVRQILAFSRRQDPIRVRMQLEPVVREALKLIRSTLPASISIQEEIAEGLPSVLADSNQIHQVVVNLCANAEYAMRGSPGVLKVSLEVKPGSVPKGSQWLQLSIADTGHGMSEALLQRIFDPCFTTKGPGEGTGLGLAVVHGIIQEHKGTIEVESRPGVGTTFRISFPASESESRERVIDLPRRVPGTGQRILFVDDEVALLNSARPLLEHRGFRVDACANPSQALERLRQDPAHYDAVVSDLTMPGLSGLELAREIRSIAPRVPILIMTGYAGDLTTDGVKQLGLSELVLKPIDFSVLAHKLAEACNTAKVGEVMRF